MKNIITIIYIFAKVSLTVLTILTLINLKLAMGKEITEDEFTESARGLPKVIETVKAIKELITTNVKEKAEETTLVEKKDIIPDPIPIPQNVLNIMSNAQMKADFLNKEKQRLEAELKATVIQIQMWNVTKMTEFWFHLADQGIKKKDYKKWVINNGIARYRK